MASIPVLLAPASLTKHLKVFLDTAGWRDKTRLIARYNQILAAQATADQAQQHIMASQDQDGCDLSLYMAIALLPKEAVTFHDKQMISLWVILQEPSSLLTSLEWPAPVSDPSIQKTIYLSWMHPSAFATPRHLLVQTPFEKMQEDITHFLTPFLQSWELFGGQGLLSPASLPPLIASIPQKWEHYSDFTLLPPTAFMTAPWPAVLKRLQAEDGKKKVMTRWEQLIQEGLQSSHIARKAIIPVKDVLRRPKIRPLTGDWKLHNKYKTWIEEEHGLLEHLSMEGTGNESSYLNDSSSIIQENEVTAPTNENFSQAYWAETSQNHVWYRWAPMFTMFSAGNITEKERIANSRPIFDARGKTVVDLYAGIGYFSLVYLIHAGAEIVHACEWNPWSVEGLLQGASKNGISYRVYQGNAIKAANNSLQERQSFHERDAPQPDHRKRLKDYGKLIVYPGDNAQWIELFEGQAHHVNLGLIPSAEPGWILGVRALCPKKGGYLHVHHNVRVGEEETFKSYLLRGLRNLFAKWKQCPSCSSSSSQTEGCCRSWSLNIKHMENVKSFAPLIFHFVFDVECRPLSLSSVPVHVS
ncbi:tRNA methyltransferase tyw3 [Modicella reniformis]|uniref:tRNA(Phe) (4-demethylwyosine(37)-C(7)) aminocarboxypropyltransferase n=1 Tax=Modicella reniformis TaxID=1440133 RepID=A0A9P6IMN5_9FUNG|nr:tRNA methyltransferase tyw3 [Modicella reniformis]